MNLNAADFENKSSNFTNVEFVVTDGKLNITPVTEKVIVTIVGHNGDYEYDGSEKTVRGYDIVSISNDLYTEADFVFTGSAEVKGTDAGIYDMNLNAADFENKSSNFTNVEFVVTDGKLNITPITEKVIVTITEHSDEYKYDGKEKVVTGYDFSTSNPLYKKEDFRFSGDDTVRGTNPGIYDMELSSDDFENINKNFTNVEFIIVDGTLKITKKDYKLAIETFVRKNKDDEGSINKLVYKEDGDNTYWYVIKVENTVEDSYPEVVDSANIIDELPSYLKFVSGEATSGTISSGDSPIIWSAKNIGYGDRAQYAYIKVEVDKSAFSEYEDNEETKNTISNIKAEIKDEKLTNLDVLNYDRNTTAFFIRYANPVNAETGSGYLYAGNTVVLRNQLPFGWTPGNNIFIVNSETNKPYTDDEINGILNSKNETKISRMLEDFIKGKDYIKKYISTKSDCSNETIRKNISELYDGNVTVSGTQVVLWYKFIKMDKNEYSKKGTRTYSITSKNDDGTTSTVNCEIDYPANAYHLDGLVVDIKTLKTIPEGSSIDISNTAKVDGTELEHTSTIKLYYESEKENIDEDVTTLELDIGEGDPLLDDKIIELVSDGNNKDEQSEINEEENISGDSNVVKGDEAISSGDVKVEEKNEGQQEKSKIEENISGDSNMVKGDEVISSGDVKVEEKNEGQQEKSKIEENISGDSNVVKGDEVISSGDVKVEEKNEEQQEEPKVEEKNEEQQEEPKVEEKDEQQKETKIKEEKKDEIIAVKPQVPSTEPQETSTDKDDEQE